MLKGPRLTAPIAGLCLALLLAFGVGRSAGADDAVMLSVTAPGAPAIALTLSDLQAIGETTLVTGTPWTDGQQTFVGVTGRKLLAALKARGVTGAATGVAAIANNDYQVVIPMAAFDQDDTLIAFSRDGAPLPIRDKGPLWIVFPFDQDAAKYRSTTYKAYAIWGLVRLELKSE
jgi:hypothetical protein